MLTEREGLKLTNRSLTWSEFQLAQRVVAQRYRQAARSLQISERWSRSKRIMILFTIIFIAVFLLLQTAPLICGELNSGRSKFLIGIVVIFFSGVGALGTAMVLQNAQASIQKLIWKSMIDPKSYDVHINHSGVGIVGERVQTNREWSSISEVVSHQGLMMFFHGMVLVLAIPESTLEDEICQQVLKFARNKISKSRTESRADVIP